jgi:hypothetical protein
LSSTICAAAIAWSTIAAAQDEAAPQPAVIAPVAPPPIASAAQPSPTAPIWYGWQTLIADSVGASLFVAGFAARCDVCFASGAIGYWTVPPIIHFSHDNVARGFADLGFRAATPLITLFVGSIIGFAIAAGPAGKDGSGDEIIDTGIAVGFLAGMVTAASVDATVIAYEQPTRDEPPPRRSAQPLRLVPTFHVNARQATAGIGAAF